MNSIIKIATVMLGLLIATPVYSNVSEQVEMAVTGVKSFRLVLKDETGNVQIRLKDTAGQTLYSEQVASPVAYNRVFNLSSLPSGEYSLELEFVNRVQMTPLVIEENQVTLQTAEMTEYFKPVVRLKGKTVSINLLNTSRDPVNILVYHSETNELLTQSRITNETTVGKLYDFSKVKPGKFLISMNGRNINYSKSIIIE
ncbi:MAG: hypothetical protein DHS20C17_10800 [Cyclobacteriaceae bacterium]|nr:MAG: hypothetical protein DHS20C17_10800 [Cyclobacteriaceae bacterium]